MVIYIVEARPHVKAARVLRLPRARRQISHIFTPAFRVTEKDRLEEKGRGARGDGGDQADVHVPILSPETSDQQSAISHHGTATSPSTTLQKCAVVPRRVRISGS